MLFQKRNLLTVMACFAFSSIALFAQDIKLPQPVKSGGMPLMEALNKRESTRTFNPEKKLSEQQLSNLLWAAFGVNRSSGKRTAPSARNFQEIDIYVCTADGAYLYLAAENTLKKVHSGDIRASAGKQDFVKKAPVVLVFVADMTKMKTPSKEDKIFYSATDTGFISQNVYLFSASEKLSTVVLGYVDKPALHKAMGLKETQSVILSQPVGFPE